ncbi:MAG: hypothetical protein LBF50_06990 [Azoarcus sp.]|jgi:IS1 family transposase|nr:hypothetical protein [Azoarcus sp.]
MMDICHVFASNVMLDFHVNRRIRAFGESLPEPVVPGGIQEIAFRRDVAFHRLKKRNAGSSRPWNTDAWEAFARGLSPERHIAGKSHTTSIERDDSNTRRHLGRFTRRTKVVSREESMVDLTLRIWHAVTTTNQFSSFQQTLLSVCTKGVHRKNAPLRKPPHLVIARSESTRQSSSGSAYLNTDNKAC